MNYKYDNLCMLLAHMSFQTRLNDFLLSNKNIVV